MLALRKTRAGTGVSLVSTSFCGPGPGRGEVEVAVQAAGICGSDLHAVAWDPSYGFMEPLLPLTLGHEFSGTVVEIGAGVEGVTEGDRVEVYVDGPVVESCPLQAHATAIIVMPLATPGRPQR